MLTLSQLDAPITLVVYAVGGVPKVPPIRNGKCEGCGVNANPPTPGAGTWGVDHLPTCSAVQIMRVEGWAKALRRAMREVGV